MNGFERAIVGEIPMAEAAAYFLRLKKFAAAPPDETGRLEGQFTVPVEVAMKLMAEIVKNEFETIYAYHVYAQSLRDLSHDSIAEHFEEHADEELEHADFLLKRLAVLGGPVSVPDVKAPAAASDPTTVIKTMIRMEQEGIALWRKLGEMMGDNPMKVTVEDYAAQEQHHLDDLWQLLPHEENRPILSQKKASEEEQIAFDPYQQRAVGHALLSQRNKGGVGALIGAVPGAIGGSILASHYGKAGPLGTALGGVGGALLGAAPGSAYALKQQQAYENLYNPEMKVAVSRQWIRESVEKAKAAPTRLKQFADRQANRSQRLADSDPASIFTHNSASNKADWAAGRADARLEKMKVAGVLSNLRKLAFAGDPQAWLAQEHMLQGAQEQAEADYFKSQAQASQEAVQQKDQELQAVQQQMQQLQEQQQQMQQQLDQSGQIQRQVLDQARQVEQAATQTAADAHQSATAAMLQSMQAQQETLRHKGLTANMHSNVQAWKDQLGQIAQADPTQGAGQQVGMPESGPIEPPAATPPQEAVGSENAPSGQAPPGEIPADGAAGQQPPYQQTPEQTLTPTAQTKTGMRKKALNASTYGALIGAPIGAGLGYATSRMQTSPGLLNKIQELEGRQERKEESFREAVELAKLKMKRDFIEAVQRHPVAGTLAGAAIGASSGSAIGASLPRIAGHLQTIRDTGREVLKLPQG